MAFTFPSALVPRRCDPEPRNTVRSGGRSVTGFEQRVIGDAGYWEVKYSDFPIMSADAEHAWMAAKIKLRQNQTALISVWRGYRSPGLLVPEAAAFNAGLQPLRSTQLVLTTRGIDLVEGALFSINDQYLHAVEEIVSRAGTPSLYVPLDDRGTPFDDPAPLSGTGPATVTYDVKIWPPLRAPLPDNAPLDFRRPKFQGVLVDINDGDTSLDVGRFGLTSFTLREP